MDYVNHQDITFMTCVHTRHHKFFMSLDHPRDVFVHSFINKLQSIEDGKLIIDIACKEEHIYLHIMKKVAIDFFNCMGKYFCYYFLVYNLLLGPDLQHLRISQIVVFQYIRLINTITTSLQ